MAYKKYIEKNGKKYGPYLYPSRRVDDKVISEYYGPHKKRIYKNILISISFLLLVILLIYGFNYIKPFISGKAVFNINVNYEEGQPLDGVLELFLKQGEMIPSSAKLVFNNNGNILEYPLSQFISGEDMVEGVFYVQEKAISGEGEGYGIPGEKVIYPVVYFSLDILSSSSSETVVEEDAISEQTTPGEETPTVEENQTVEETAPTETSTSEENQTVEETAPTETSTAEETPVTEQTTPFEEKKEDKKEENKEEKLASEDKKEEIPIEEAPTPFLTGNIISSFFKGVANLFLGLTGTGKVTMNIKKTLEANVSSEALFVHNLQDMETAELKKGSVYIIDSKGKEKKIDDSSVSLDIAGEKIIVSTDYSEIGEGFGEEYIGNKQKTIYLNLSSLDIIFEKGNLSIELVYGNEKIVSLTTSLEQGKIKTNTSLPEVPLANQTILLNETNQTLELAMEFVSSAGLSEEEKAELFAYFGNISISTEKSEVFNGRFIRNYKLGDYAVEYSYDYGGEITSRLEEQMQEDLMKWLRDILKEISKEKTPSEPVEILLGNRSLFEDDSTLESEPSLENDSVLNNGSA